ncbi:MAG: hypothetical protein PVI01_05665 [Gemmatimonadales bacterium]|jgi:C4-dicarboxylate-specific signal transduction histidine kinase
MSTPENREAAFIGQITAGATHELRNVLAIVNESAGLIADIVSSPELRGLPKSEKLMRAVGRIETQVKRGSDLLTGLNRFAHSLDHAEDEVDLDELVQQIGFLCQRMARKGRHQVRAEPGQGGLTVVVNLLRLQMGIYAAVECCLEQLPEGGTLNVQPVRQGDRVAVEFKGEAAGKEIPLEPSELGAWSQLTTVLAELGASLDKVDAALGFRLTLPG